MNLLPYHILTDILEVINAASEYSDCGFARRKALDVLFRTISAEGAILILPDKTTSTSYVMVKNLDKKFTDYYKEYFHQFDPLQVMQGLHQRTKLSCNNRVCAYSYDLQRSTEYYNDFLKPQKVHHKLVADLVAEKEVYGRVAWVRSLKTGRFSDHEIKLAKAISPYLAHALAYNELRERLKIKGKILHYIEKQSSVGFILVGEKLQIVYINPKAEELLDVSEGCVSDDTIRMQILSQLLKDCREIKAGMKDYPADLVAIPRKRTLQGGKHIQFSATYKTLYRTTGAKNTPLFMVCIEALPQPLDAVTQRLAKSYHLSKREVDVVGRLFSGLKNAQIAEKLYISEITVKKHLQNIYHKVGVCNRTSLINKMLTL
jgi:DNA-binding CsgD family transcriptional regulator/PAS domain-containing protein